MWPSGSAPCAPRWCAEPMGIWAVRVSPCGRQSADSPSSRGPLRPSTFPGQASRIRRPRDLAWTRRRPPCSIEGETARLDSGWRRAGAHKWPGPADGGRETRDDSVPRRTAGPAPALSTEPTPRWTPDIHGASSPAPVTSAGHERRAPSREPGPGPSRRRSPARSKCRRRTAKIHSRLCSRASPEGCTRPPPGSGPVLPRGSRLSG